MTTGVTLTREQYHEVLTRLTLGQRRTDIARALGVPVDLVTGVHDGRYNRGMGEPIERDRWIASRKVKVIP